MKSNRLKALLFATIFIEGYVVLAVELLAIRQTMPMVGNGTDVISVVIAAVLLPLSFGYYAGGRYKKKKKRNALRNKLINNLLIASVILTIGLSTFIVQYFFDTLSTTGIDHRLLQITFYSLIFIVYPVFLLGQTIPLVSNFFSSQLLSDITGKMLFFSTVGSFLGSVVSTIILMSYLGVHNTVSVIISLLLMLSFILLRNKMEIRSLIISIIFAITFILNGSLLLKYQNIVDNNQYNTVKIFNHKNLGTILSLNNNTSSAFHPEKGVTFENLKFIEDKFITPINHDGGPPKKILVIGAGGFVIGFDDSYNEYTYVDIDKNLLPISEQYLLPHEVLPNKAFEAVPARGYLYNNKNKKFDLIILDAYSGTSSVPEQLITQNFFKQMKEALTPDGRVVMNFVTCPHFTNKFSVNLDNTIRSVFPFVNRQVIPEVLGYIVLDNTKTSCLINVLYTYFNGQVTDNKIYTDDKNSSFMDQDKYVLPNKDKCWAPKQY